MLTVENVASGCLGVWALHGVAFTVVPRSIGAVPAPTGVRKSTWQWVLQRNNS
jgi:hypothetical protein